MGFYGRICNKKTILSIYNRGEILYNTHNRNYDICQNISKGSANERKGNFMTILELLENDGRLTAKELAAMLEKEVGDIKKEISELEDRGVILGYKTIIDWDKTDREYVTALIEIKVVPQRHRGFDEIADKICRYPEVTSVYLMSGGFDLAVMVEGKTMREVALFVAEKLALIESVTATATHFVLRRYKDKGVIYQAPEKDERGECGI
jgi:DNA-binding Lrp family transcriptional regulator